MDKKILPLAIISIVLQTILLIMMWNQIFTDHIRFDLAMLIAIFHMIAIPYTINHLVKKTGGTKLYKKPLNIIGTLFTFPLILITLVIYLNFQKIPTEDANVEDVHLYTSEGREINTTDYDSFMKDTGNIARVKIDEAKSE